MKQEEKDFLLKDLCARLPYRVKCCIYNFGGDTIRIKEDILWSVQGDNILTLKSYVEKGEAYMYHQIKPYLFPLSSMTEGQREEFLNIQTKERKILFDALIEYKYGKYDKIPIIASYKQIDWLTKNYFDYRGLIEKGLALDATGLNIY